MKNYHWRRLLLLLFFGAPWVFSAPPTLLITNFSTWTWIDRSEITVAGMSDQPNLTYCVSVFSQSNGGVPFWGLSNHGEAGLSFSIPGVMLSNVDGYTNWIEVEAYNSNAETNRSPRVGIIFSLPVLVTWKQQTVEAPVAGGYRGSSSDLVPGSIVTIQIICSNAGQVMVANVCLREQVNTNYFCFLAALPAGAARLSDGQTTIETPLMPVDCRISSIDFIFSNVAPGSVVTASYQLVVQ